MKEQGKLLNLILIQSTWHSEHPKYISINEEALKQILGEAKKEFESLISGTWDVDEEGFHPNRYAKDSWLNPREAIKWFRKWFGNER